MRRDPRYVADWYAIRFSLAALHANEWARLGAEPATLRVDLSYTGFAAAVFRDRSHDEEARARHEQARQQSLTLSLACVETLLELGVSRRRHPLIALRRARKAGRRRRHALRAHLQRAMLPAALVLLAGTLKRDEEAAASPRDLEALQAELRREEPRASALVLYVESRRPTPRVEYNLACLHATWGERERATALLRRSLQRTPASLRVGLAHRALTDPTLTAIVGDVADARELLAALGIDEGGIEATAVTDAGAVAADADALEPG